jgi:GWxTD domain-containing protein
MFKFRLVVLFLLCFQLIANSQVFAYYGSSVFNTPQNQPYVETYLTIHGMSLFAKEENGISKNSVNVSVLILKDSAIVKANKYNLNGPDFAVGRSAPTFIDNQRYTLPNGHYAIEINVSDNYSMRPKSLIIRDSIHVDFNNHDVLLSDLQILENFNKSDKPGPLSKSGFDLVPYTSNYYPESSKQLAFYIEAYNAKKVFGEKSAFIYYYYLEMADNKTKLNDYGSFKRQASEEVNPFLARMDISNLGTGNYNLVVQLKDAENIVRAQKKFYFQRLNRMFDISSLQSLSQAELEAQYFGNCNNHDTLKMFVECLWPIANALDKDRIINQSLTKDNNMMKRFVVDFWQRRAADTANPVKLWGDYYKNVQVVMANFKCGKQKGYYTERGRVYLQYGPPSQRAMEPNEHNTFPYEIWQYYRTVDQTNGQFFSNRKFVFVNKMLGDDCYNLVHSDMRGEINNPRWQFEVTRRNTNGMSDLDNVTPAGTQFNQFNQIFDNPR